MSDREPDDLSPLVEEFRQALADCEDLYRSCAVECARSRPELDEEARGRFLRRMVDLHRGLVLKVFVEVAFVERRWSPEELRLAAELFEHLWRQRLSEKQVRVALAHYMDQPVLSWDVLLGPFERLESFRNWTHQLRSVVLRVANLVAKADGNIQPRELDQLRWIQAEMERVLERLPLSEVGLGELLSAGGREALQLAPFTASPFRPPEEKPDDVFTDVQVVEPGRGLQESLAELDGLIGLDGIKREVHGLVNFLQMQKAREEFGLPRTPLSLHTVFSGNPGTGKTTVARLLGQVFGAMGILSRGHLVETDRAGLVAEYAGQTAPKAHRKIDEALDGVLFIDEAYSLVADKGDDPYGQEAVQVLLKRMEDDRDRLVVVLAGYPAPLERLLRSNPGLSSRFGRNFRFPDYTATELGRIFETLCHMNRYELPPATRVKLLLGFAHLLRVRDEHFGNGRLARNVFEQALRRLADRIAGVVPLTRELLTTLHAEDILMAGVPDAVWADLDEPRRRFLVNCPGCQGASRVRQEFLGRRVKCKECQESFEVGWGEVLDGE